ncbi:MAG TPA: PAS domain S-box protein, partial [Acidiferrobacterales bacterium]|nr:PAS domain S-box protein [Acidiferrobacterales bacterium]
MSRLWPRLEMVHVSLTDPEARRQSLLLARLLLVVLLLGGLSVIIQAALVPGFRRTLLVLAPALGLLAFAAALNYHGWFRAAGTIAVTVMLAGCFGVLFVNPQDVFVYAFLVVPLFLARLFLPGRLFVALPVVAIIGVLGASWLLGSGLMQAIIGSVFLATMATLFGIARQHRVASEHDRRAALAASERELRTILDNMQDTYYRTDQDGLIVRASESATQLLGYAPDEVLGLRLADFYVDADGRERLLAALKAAGGTLRNYEVALRHRTGSVRWVSTNAQYVRAADGNVIGIEGTTRDITERKRAEDALLESQRRLETLMANLPGMVYRCRNDSDWTMEFMSVGVRALTGHAPEDFTSGRVTYNALIHP